LAPKEKEWKHIPDPNKCVGLYVVVCYNKAACPGLVVDAGEIWKSIQDYSES
jgi:hypothetical protein